MLYGLLRLGLPERGRSTSLRSLVFSWSLSLGFGFSLFSNVW